jgi:hypothetical protein
MEPLLDLRDRYGILIVEDAAEALGARIGESEVGTIGDIGCFSFNGNTVITAVGGGMIVTDNADLAAKCRHLATQAKLPGRAYVHDEIGFNYPLEEDPFCGSVDMSESLRESCVLCSLRGWNHVKQVEAISARVERTRRTQGARSRGRLSVAMEDSQRDRREARCAITSRYGSGFEKPIPGLDNRPGLTSDERERVKELEREVKELRRANEMAESDLEVGVDSLRDRARRSNQEVIA